MIMPERDQINAYEAFADTVAMALRIYGCDRPTTRKVGRGRVEIRPDAWGALAAVVDIRGAVDTLEASLGMTK